MNPMYGLEKRPTRDLKSRSSPPLPRCFLIEMNISIHGNSLARFEGIRPWCFGEKHLLPLSENFLSNTSTSRVERQHWRVLDSSKESEDVRCRCERYHLKCELYHLRGFA